MLVTLTLLLAVQTPADSAQVWIGKAVEAQGGAKALTAASNLRMRATLVRTDGAPAGSLLVITRADGARRVEQRHGEEHQIQACLGDDYWMTVRGQVIDMPKMARRGFELDRMLDRLLMRFHQHGLAAELVGRTAEGGRPLVHVRLAAPPSESPNESRPATEVPGPFDLYLDEGNGLLVRLEHPAILRSATTVTVTQTFAEYRAVGEALLPHVITVKMGKTPEFRVRIEGYEIVPASKLPDRLFRRRGVK